MKNETPENGYKNGMIEMTNEMFVREIRINIYVYIKECFFLKSVCVCVSVCVHISLISYAFASLILFI